MNKNPPFIHRVECKISFRLWAIPEVRHSFVELSIINITRLGRQPKFCKNPVLPFIFLIFISILFGLILIVLDSCFVLFCLMCVLSALGSFKKTKLGLIYLEPSFWQKVENLCKTCYFSKDRAIISS